MSLFNTFWTSIEEFTAEIDSDFTFNHHATYPLRQFEDEYLQSSGFSSSCVGLGVFNNFDGVSDLVDGHGGVSNKDRHPYTENAYAFEFGDVYESIGTNNFSTQVCESIVPSFIQQPLWRVQIIALADIIEGPWPCVAVHE